MNHTHVSKLLFGLVPAAFVIILVLLIIVFYYNFSRTRIKSKLDKVVATVEEESQDLEKQKKNTPPQQISEEETLTATSTEKEDLTRFNGGEDLTVFDILDAPGEVIGKSSYGTLYKAALERTNMIRLLRFIRPAACASEKSGGCDAVEPVVRLLGSVRHSNLVPLLAFYAGPRGEKLLVHPFYRFGNLTRFIADGNGVSHKWAVIYRISLGIARGMDHLHNGLPHKPIIHGNLKSRNILLDRNYEPFASDFGLHLLLNPSASQEMLETLASEGYAAPELIKMKDANKETDVYSLGVILLELLSGKEVVCKNLKTPSSQDCYLPIVMRNAILDHRISDLFHPDVLLSQTSDGGRVTEECILLFFQLAMDCCSPSPPLRPNVNQIVRKLEEIGG